MGEIVRKFQANGPTLAELVAGIEYGDVGNTEDELTVLCGEKDNEDNRQYEKDNIGHYKTYPHGVHGCLHSGVP